MFEINLVPDLKVQILKSQRVRNIIFIICVFLMSGVGIIVATLTSIWGVQSAVLSGQKGKLDNMSAKITSYSDLNNFLTIQNQLNKLGEIEKVRADYARIFNLINVLIPTNGDVIKFSEMRIDFNKNTISFDAIADRKKPGAKNIDYNVLEEFISSMPYMKYDYGVYKNEHGFTIPSICILETDEKGNVLRVDPNEVETDEDGNIKIDEETGKIIKLNPGNNEENPGEEPGENSGEEPGENSNDNQEGAPLKGDLYAIWTKGVNGCDPEAEEESEVEVLGDDGEPIGVKIVKKTEEVFIREEDIEKARYSTDNELIWRIPQFKKWYLGENGQKYMNDNGEINNIRHFESECIKYQLVNNRWSETNECNLINGELDVTSHSNARQSSTGELVLSFSASLSYNPESMLYKNKHTTFIAPTGYINVTDSNIQMQGLFEKPAVDCKEDDFACMKEKDRKEPEE